jgi:hypothetical protein
MNEKRKDDKQPDEVGDDNKDDKNDSEEEGVISTSVKKNNHGPLGEI